MLLNNICETFNNNILEAKEKSIMTMLEWIRKWIVTKPSDLRYRDPENGKGKNICPKIRKFIEKIIDKAVDFMPIKSDDWHYKVFCYDGDKYVVNFAKSHVHLQKMRFDRHSMQS